MLGSSILVCMVREVQAWFMKRAWISPQRTIQELVCLFSFFLDMGKKNNPKGFKGIFWTWPPPADSAQSWSAADGSRRVLPTSSFSLLTCGMESLIKVSLLFLSQTRKVPWTLSRAELTWLWQKKPQSGLQFYLPVKHAILKKHITLDFWPAIQYLFFNCHHLLQLISPNKQETHYSWQSNSEVQTRLYGCSGCVLRGAKGLLSLLSITAFGPRHVRNNSLALSWSW